MRAQPKDGERWFKPPSTDPQREPGYDAWLATEIETACAELDASKGIPAEQVWKELGLE